MSVTVERPPVAAPLALPGRTVRVGERISLRVRTRPVVLAGVLVVVLAGLLIIGIGTGEIAIGPADVVTALLGGGDEGTRFVVNDLRLPRALCGLLVGLALGLSGAIFQALTRNPLGSPDIVGFPQGATVGALVVITILAGSGFAVTAGALAGGVVTAALVYALAFRRGGTSGYRLVLIGVAMAFFMLALIEYLLANARVEDAQEGTRWLLGSLNGRTWDDVWPVLISLCVLLPLAIPASRGLRVLELGDDQAHALGANVERVRIGLIALSVGLVSVATVSVGPIGFVALTAPQIARRLARAPGPPLVCSALMGAVIVAAADLTAQRLVADTPLPVGVMTGAFGGLYLAALLTLEWRSPRR